MKVADEKDPKIVELLKERLRLLLLSDLSNPLPAPTKSEAKPN